MGRRDCAIVSMMAQSFAPPLCLAVVLLACGQTASLEVEEAEAVRENDGRVTIRAKVYCRGAGDEDCESGACVVAKWGDSEAGAVAIESNKACWTRTIQKTNGTGPGDNEAVTLTSASPIEGTPTAKLSFDRGVSATTVKTPPR